MVPCRRGGATPLSAAGRRLASSLRTAGRTPGAHTPAAEDAQLRASYRVQTPKTGDRHGQTPSSLGRGGTPAAIDRWEPCRSQVEGSHLSAS